MVDIIREKAGGGGGRGSKDGAVRRWLHVAISSVRKHMYVWSCVWLDMALALLALHKVDGGEGLIVGMVR